MAESNPPAVAGKVKDADVPPAFKPEKPEAVAPPARPADTDASVAATLKHLEERTRLAAPAAATPELDRTVPGGKYKVKGKLVNAHGREIHEDGTLVHPEQQQIDAFGRLV